MMFNKSELKQIYFLNSDNKKNQVTKEEWIKAERNAGFNPSISITSPQYMKVCVTVGFSKNGISGTIQHEIQNNFN